MFWGSGSGSLGRAGSRAGASQGHREGGGGAAEAQGNSKVCTHGEDTPMTSAHIKTTLPDKAAPCKSCFCS